MTLAVAVVVVAVVVVMSRSQHVRYSGEARAKMAIGRCPEKPFNRAFPGLQPLQLELAQPSRLRYDLYPLIVVSRTWRLGPVGGLGAAMEEDLACWEWALQDRRRQVREAQVLGKPE